MTDPAQSEAPSATRAWAVRQRDTILSETVHSHRRGAIVNWLVTAHKLPIFAFHTDAEIECWWEHYTAGWHPSTDVIEVEIKAI